MRRSDTNQGFSGGYPIFGVSIGHRISFISYDILRLYPLIVSWRSGRAAGHRPWLTQCHRTRLGLGGILESNFAVGVDYQMISNADLSWFIHNWVNFKHSFERGLAHLVTQMGSSSSLTCAPRQKEISQMFPNVLSQTKYQNKKVVFYGQPFWPSKFLLHPEELGFSSTPQPADWFQAAAWAEVHPLGIIGRWLKKYHPKEIEKQFIAILL